MQLNDDFSVLWNIIQFSNEVCNTTSADVQGVCYTASECTARGGSPSATCAAGFGTCCTCEKTHLTLSRHVLCN